MNRINSISILMGGGLAVISTAAPYLIGQAIDNFHQNRQLALKFSAYACICILAGPCLKVLVNLFLSKVSSQTRLLLKKDLFNSLCMSNILLANKGAVIDLVDGDVDGAIYLYHRVYFDAALNSSLMLLSLGVVYFYYPSLFTAPFLALLFGAIFLWVSRRVSNGGFLKYVHLNTALIGDVCSKLMSSGYFPLKDYSARVGDIKREALFAHLKLSLLNSFASLGYLLGVVLLFFFGAQLFSSSELSAGDLFSSLIYVERVLVPAMSLVAMYHSTREAAVRRARIEQNIIGGRCD